MMAAIQASKSSQVVLLEQNEKLGKKLYITGKGRCNFTNNKDISEFFPELVRNPSFLYSAFYSFSNQDLVNFLQLPYKVERGDRIFPESDKSSDVIRALETFCQKGGVDIRKNTKVLGLEKEGGQFSIETNKGNLTCDRVILATGGRSYPRTGSQGDGYDFAKKLGHRIIPLRPALVPLILKDSWTQDLEGLSLRNVTLKARGDGKEELFGEALITKTGLSGPIALSLSSKINRWRKVDLSLDLKPALDFQSLDQSLLRDFDQNKNKEVLTVMKSRLPQALAEVFLNVVQVDSRKKIHDLTREDRDKLVHGLKNFPLHFKGLDSIERGIVTSGGVDTLEVDPSTMESKLIKGLYFSGELLDLDALTGGFNLQIAFSTGYLAGENSRLES